MIERCAAAWLAGALVTACGPSEPVPAAPRSAPAPRSTATAPATDETIDLPGESPRGSYYRIQDFVGKKLDQLDRATCADASGFRLARALMLDGRALAVRSCARFRGLHDAVDDGGEAGSELTIISDGGRVLFAVASKEYDLDRARKVADALMSQLLNDGCQQVHSTELAAGFSGCPGSATWAAVSRVPLLLDGASRHGVVLEVATDRVLAGRIAAAYAELAR